MAALKLNIMNTAFEIERLRAVGVTIEDIGDGEDSHYWLAERNGKPIGSDGRDLSAVVRRAVEIVFREPK